MAVLSVFGIVAGLITWGCSMNSDSAPLSPDVVYVFRRFDWSRPGGPADDYFAFRGADCFAVIRPTRATSGNVTYYACTSLPAGLVTDISAWARKAGDRKVSLEPDTAPLYRTAIPLGGGTKEEAVFDPNIDMARFYSPLYEAIIRDEYRTTEVPEWVLENEEVKRVLGLPEKQ